MGLMGDGGREEERAIGGGEIRKLDDISENPTPKEARSVLPTLVVCYSQWDFAAIHLPR